MQKLYLAMVGLPARGKSTLARRLHEGLRLDGFNAAVFNNGDLRRQLLGSESTHSDFFNPNNAAASAARHSICIQNLNAARDFLRYGGDVAILDATNASPQRRAFIEKTLDDHPVIFIECVNEDPLLQKLCIERKAELQEYSNYSREEACESFRQRIAYYDTVYQPLEHERFWIRVDPTSNRILDEHPCESSSYYPAIRDTLVTTWVRRLYLVRHGQTEYNIVGRIGGDPNLSDKGREQANALARHMRTKYIPFLFTSTKTRSMQTAAPVLESRPKTKIIALNEFDEIRAGDCENMRYEDIRREMPQVTAARNANKYAYAYPNGESYAMLIERVRRGLQRALFIAGDDPLMIIGHQAINRVILSLFLRRRSEDIPYTFVPQNQYYHISSMPRKKLFELVPY